MAQPKIIQYLLACEASELLRLARFVDSPYHCERTDIRRLISYLVPLWPHFSTTAISKQKIWQTIYPDEAFTDKKLRYLFSDACRTVEDFWCTERYQQQARQQNDLAAIFSERGLHKAYERQNREWQATQAALPFYEPERYYLAYERADIAEKHFERQRQRRFDTSIERASEQLDRFYFFQQLSYACGMLERQNILQGEYQLPFTEDWLAHLRGRHFLDDPQIELYYHILQMQRFEAQAHFHTLREQLRQLADRAHPEVLRSAYLAAINYCLRQMRKGTAGFDAQALELYVDGLQQKVLLDNEALSPWTFNNVVKLALRLQRFEWISQFMSDYEALLPEDFREDVLHYNRAELYYATQALQQAQTALLQVSYSDLNYYLGARVLLAKIYFETDEIEPLLSLLAAFMMFLKRNKKISNTIRQTCLNFCNILFQITKQKPGSQLKIQQKIKDTALLTERQWLLAQVQQG